MVLSRKISSKHKIEWNENLRLVTAITWTASNLSSYNKEDFQWKIINSKPFWHRKKEVFQKQFNPIERRFSPGV